MRRRAETMKVSTAILSIAIIVAAAAAAVPDEASAYELRIFGTVEDGHGHRLREAHIVAADTSVAGIKGEIATNASGEFDLTVDVNPSCPGGVQAVLFVYLRDYSGSGESVKVGVVNAGHIGRHSSVDTALEDTIFMAAVTAYRADPPSHGNFSGPEWEVHLDFTHTQTWNDQVKQHLALDVAGCGAIGPVADLMQPWDDVGTWVELNLTSAAVTYYHAIRAFDAFEHPDWFDQAFTVHDDMAVIEFGTPAYGSRPAAYNDSRGFHCVYIYEGGRGVFNDNNVDLRESWYPDNREWHELCHYLNVILYEEPLHMVGTNHNGYFNDESNDSVMEGFAEFCSMLIAEYHGDAAAQLYHANGADYNLQTGYPVWGPYWRARSPLAQVDTLLVSVPDSEEKVEFPIPAPTARAFLDDTRDGREEFAVAAILWDLHDAGLQDMGPVHSNWLGGPIRDRVTIDTNTIIRKIDDLEPKTIVELLAAFSDDTDTDSDGNGLLDIQEVFIMHGAFRDANPRNFEFDGPTSGSDLLSRYFVRAREILELGPDDPFPPLDDIFAVINAFAEAFAEIPGQTGSCVPYRGGDDNFTCAPGGPDTGLQFPYRSSREAFMGPAAAHLEVLDITGITPGEGTQWSFTVSVTFPDGWDLEDYEITRDWDRDSGLIPFVMPPAGLPSLAEITVATDPDVGTTDPVVFSSYGFWRAVIEADEEATSFASVTLTAGGLDPTATLNGVVTDAMTGHPLSGAGAVLDGGDHSATADGDGRFTIDGLDPGFYELEVTHEDYEGLVLTIALGREEPDLEIALYPVYDDTPEGPDEVEPIPESAEPDVAEPDVTEEADAADAGTDSGLDAAVDAVPDAADDMAEDAEPDAGDGDGGCGCTILR